MPVLLSPVGLTGMFCPTRRGAGAVKAATAKGVPLILSPCRSARSRRSSPRPSARTGYQLYVLKDRGFMKNALDRAMAAASPSSCSPSTCRHRRALPRRSFRHVRRSRAAAAHPAGDAEARVGDRCRPCSAGRTISATCPKYLGKPIALEDYMAGSPRISIRRSAGADLRLDPRLLEGRDHPEGHPRCRGCARGGRLRPRRRHRGVEPRRPAARRRAFDGEGAAGIVDAVGSNLTVLVDGGIRSGLDVVRMLALGAKGCLSAARRPMRSRPPARPASRTCSTFSPRKCAWR